MTVPPKPKRRPASTLAAAYGLTPAPDASPPPAALPPRTDGAIRSEIVNTPGDDRFHSLIRSAYRDSLERLTGAPAVYQYDVPPYDQGVDPRAMLAEGQYLHHAAPGATSVGADTVVLSPKLLENHTLGGPPRSAAQQPGRPQPEFILAHELGHRSYDARTLGAAGGVPDPRVAQQDSTFAAQTAAAPATIKSAYWATNPAEHYAEAFANGVSYLRATGGQPADPDVVSRTHDTADRYEHAVPGTSAMVSSLLQDPLYANHPIRRAMLVPRVAADATSVRSAQ